MARFIGLGYSVEDLLILNRVRKHQQVLFLSDILGAGGELLDKQYFQKQAGCRSLVHNEIYPGDGDQSLNASLAHGNHASGCHRHGTQ
jgi:hypothetical protein